MTHAELDYTCSYPSQRMPVMARNMVATSQPLAAQAGLEALYRGGNAVDAALAAAITLTVVEPTSNGIGSDAFCILWDGERLHGLNASGRSPQALTPERFKGCAEMPLRGWDSVTVPGAVSAWAELSARFGKLPFAQLFERAVRYADEGFLVSPVTARAWSYAPKAFAGFAEFARGFLPGGRAPRAGEPFRYPEQARTLEQIAASRGESFYRGALAAAIVADARAQGGLLNEADLAEHRPEWVGTLSQAYGQPGSEAELHEIPPNGQGLAALQALGILRHLGVGEHPPESAESLHLQLEAMKLAFADAYRYLADPAHMSLKPEDLLAEDYLAERARLVDRARAQDPGYGAPKPGGTVYLAAADASGMMVSFIQSNYHGFGSGVVVQGTGISLQNRGAGFVIEPGHPNAVGPGKRPFHTIIPAFLTRSGAPACAFGVMGGPMQPQGHVQMVLRLVDHAQNPQAAADAPRWRVLGGLSVALERGFDPVVLAELEARGHRIGQSELGGDFSFGGAQLVWRAEDGYVAGSDPRKDGQAVGF